jgi:hypothetical protein
MSAKGKIMEAVALIVAGVAAVTLGFVVAAVINRWVVNSLMYPNGLGHQDYTTLADLGWVLMCQGVVLIAAFASIGTVLDRTGFIGKEAQVLWAANPISLVLGYVIAYAICSGDRGSYSHSLFFRPSNLMLWATLSMILLRGALSLGRRLHCRPSDS